jgi:hypothetical protein
MSFLKHEKISLQKYSMLKIVQDKHLLKTLVATLIRMRRSKEQHSTDNTNSQNISHRLIVSMSQYELSFKIISRHKYKHVISVKIIFDIVKFCFLLIFNCVIIL